jgi:hypothetical protein
MDEDSDILLHRREIKMPNRQKNKFAQDELHLPQLLPTESKIEE